MPNFLVARRKLFCARCAFRIRSKARLEVRRVPEFKKITAPGACYERPALDGARPGIFYANRFDVKATPNSGMRTLAYHEGIPGHHFQFGIAQELEGFAHVSHRRTLCGIFDQRWTREQAIEYYTRRSTGMAFPTSGPRLSVPL